MLGGPDPAMGGRGILEELLLLSIWYNAESLATRSILDLFLNTFLSSKCEA